MEDSQLFNLFLGLALILWGASVFVPERTLVVVAAVAAIVAGVLALLLAF